VTGGPLGAVLSPLVGRAVMGRTWAWALIGVVAGPMSWVISTMPLALLTYQDQPELASQKEVVEEAPSAVTPEPAAAPDPVTTVPEKPAPAPQFERIPSERVPEATAPVAATQRAPAPPPASAPAPPRQSGAQASAGSIIRSHCSSEWGTDYRMVEYCVNQQTEAHSKLQRIPNNSMKSQCESEWGTDYRMIEYCYQTQAGAKQRLGM